MESSEESTPSTMAEHKERKPTPQQSVPRWRQPFGGRSKEDDETEEETYRARSTLGILSDKQTDEVPGETRHLLMGKQILLQRVPAEPQPFTVLQERSFCCPPIAMSLSE